MKKKILIIIVLIFASIPKLASAETQCWFSAKLSDGSLNEMGFIEFENDKITINFKDRTKLDGYETYSNRYIPNMSEEIDKFDEQGEKCPKWLIRYGLAIKFKLFWSDEEEEYNAFVKKHNKIMEQFAEFYVKESENNNPEIISEGNVEVYKKEYTSNLYGEDFGDLIFEVGYDDELQIYTAVRAYFSKKTEIPIKMVDESFEKYKTRLDSIVNGGPGIDYIFCAKKNAQNNEQNGSYVVNGSKIENGDFFCSFDSYRVLATDKMTFSTIPTPQKSEKKERFSPEKLCDDGNCDISISNLCNNTSVISVLRFLGILLFIAKVLVPLIIIGMGIYHLFQIITSGKDEEVKKQVNNIVKRVITGVIIFLLPSIVYWIFSIAGATENTYGNCVNCILELGKCKTD